MFTFTAGIFLAIFVVFVVSQVFSAETPSQNRHIRYTAQLPRTRSPRRLGIPSSHRH